MKPISIAKEILSGIPKEIRRIHEAENYIRVAMLAALQSVHPVKSEIKRVKLAHCIEVVYINVTTLKRSYHLNVIKILTNSGNFFFLELPPEIKHHVGLAEAVEEYRKVLGVV